MFVYFHCNVGHLDYKSVQRDIIISLQWIFIRTYVVKKCFGWLIYFPFYFTGSSDFIGSELPNDFKQMTIYIAEEFKATFPWPCLNQILLVNRPLHIYHSTHRIISRSFFFLTQIFLPFFFPLFYRRTDKMLNSEWL